MSSLLNLPQHLDSLAWLQIVKSNLRERKKKKKCSPRKICRGATQEAQQSLNKIVLVQKFALAECWAAVSLI